MQDDGGLKWEPEVNLNTKPFARLGIRAAVAVWAAPRGSHRSKHLSQHLGADVRHVYLTRKKGWAVAPIKYFYQAIATLALLARHRYQLVIVQNPPVFAALSVYIYTLFSRARFIIDSHTEALLAPVWRWTQPLHRFLSRRAITTMVTNDHLLELVTSWTAHGFLLRDVPSTLSTGRSIQLDTAALNVAVVCSASRDEPIDQVLKAARGLPDVAFFVTGKYDTRSTRHTVEAAPTNVHFAGYLPDEEYYGLLQSVQMVMCLTTENHTHQSGASDALWMGTPIITSDWPVLRAYFHKGTIYTDNTAESLRQAVLRMQHSLPTYQAEVAALRGERQREWLERERALMCLIEQALPSRLPKRPSQPER